MKVCLYLLFPYKDNEGFRYWDFLICWKCKIGERTNWWRLKWSKLLRVRGKVDQWIERANGYETNHSNRTNCIKTTKRPFPFGRYAVSGNKRTNLDDWNGKRLNHTTKIEIVGVGIKMNSSVFSFSLGTTRRTHLTPWPVYRSRFRSSFFFFKSQACSELLWVRAFIFRLV